ncbi:hypothetical protein [Acidiferrobacter thiooxydans]|uniref:Uncharacterized protein n=1 Tax=Acidiferrobacter thiooxydans TaxID=163359 RepID=A0A368HEU2_9GAMM|nr:hypothetical protein [Acidiferrobacter thiooxydans]RCN55709.1 hypothetical protein C4900_07195 [Acidiferrobacter thiooxydans]
MTCEVVVMNKRGIALAADSAVTLSDGDGNASKVYYTAEKLFCLSPDLPVAIMTYGPADIMGVPWETVVKVYAQKLGGRRFDTLAEYAQDFLAFIEGADWLFPGETQTHWLQSLVYGFWKECYVDELERMLAEEEKTTPKGKLKKLAAIIAADHEDWERYPDLACVSSGYGQRVREIFAEALDEAEHDLLEELALTPALQEALRKTVEFAYQKEWFHPRDRSHVVIAGMGEAEPFPILLEYEVGTLAAGTLRYRKADETRVGEDSDGTVAPFGQREIIDSVIQGIHPRIYGQLMRAAARMPQDLEDYDDEDEPEEIEERAEAFSQLVREEVLRPYAKPLLSAVSALPRQDLAKMAESLVNLTAFFMRMSADEEQTVSEPVDVALLSKGDGFIWVKHKDVRGLAYDRSIGA